MYELKTVKSKEELLKLFDEKGYIHIKEICEEDNHYILHLDNFYVCFFDTTFRSCGKTIKMRKVTDKEKQKWIAEGAETMSYDYITKSGNYYIQDWLK